MAGFLLKIGQFPDILNTIKNGYQDLFMIVLLPPIIFERYLSP